MKRMAALLSIAFLSLAAGAQTNDPQALAQRGRDAITHGEPEKAVELFEKAVALKPNNAVSEPDRRTIRLAGGLRLRSRHRRRERVGRIGASDRDPKARRHRRSSRVRAHSHRGGET